MKDVPWWVPEAITFFDGVLTELDRPSAFEWGCGGSTLWLALRCSSVLSIEHDVKWADEICPQLVAISPTAKVQFVALGPSYEKSVRHRQPKVVCVDGRRRVACVKEAIPFLQKDGFLLLDDSQRDQYKPAIDLMRGWKQWHFTESEGRRTSVFKKP